jgi:hypothetical protein
MKLIMTLALMGLLGLNVACDRRGGDNIEREEAVDEVGHEMDEMGDEIEETVD